MIFMDKVQSTYHKQDWHSSSHLVNVLQVHALAGDAPTIVYDKEDGITKQANLVGSLRLQAVVSYN